MVDLDTLTRERIAQEDADRFAQTREEVQAALEHERRQKAQAAQIAALRSRLEALQATSFEQERAAAETALDAYAAALAGWNDELHAIQAELSGIGPLPPDVIPAYQDRTVKIGPVAARPQRLQARIADLALAVVRRHQPHGFISLDKPMD